MVPMMIHDVIFSNIFVRVGHSIYTVLPQDPVKTLEYTKMHALLDQKVVTPPFETINSIWIAFVCSRWAEIDMEKPVTAPREIRPYLGRTFTSMASGVVKVQNCSLVVHSPKSAFALWQVRITIAYIFSILIECSNNALFNPYRY